MSSWLAPLPVLATALVLTISLFVARRIADRFGSDQLSIPRVAGFAVLTLGLAAAAALLRDGLFFGLVASLLGLSLVTSAAFEIRGGALRRRLAIVELYALTSLFEYLYLRARGLVEGTRASLIYGWALDNSLSELTVPWLCAALPAHAPVWALPANLAGSLAQTLASNLALMIAAGTFVSVAFVAAYLADHPLPAPGTELLPFPTIVSGIFGVVVLGAWLVPAGPFAIGFDLVAVLLSPFYLAEALVLLQRWLRPVRTRAFLLVILVGAAIWLPAIGVALIALGWLAQILRLRELLPFAALVETPLGRPRLGLALGGTLGLALLFAASAAMSHRALYRVSPELGAPAELCGSVKSQVSWPTRSVTFTTPKGSFEMDVDEQPLPAGLSTPAELERACTEKGKRLCTSDEWYLACLCTYPRDAEPGTKLTVNYYSVARTDQERKSKPASPEATTMSSEKQTELRSLLVGRSEVVSGGPGASVLVAGPSDAIDDVSTQDCRQRAMVSPWAVGVAGSAVAGLRCCK